jgi:hypothetical protein
VTSSVTSKEEGPLQVGVRKHPSVLFPQVRGGFPLLWFVRADRIRTCDPLDPQIGGRSDRGVPKRASACTACRNEPGTRLAQTVAGVAVATAFGSGGVLVSYAVNRSVRALRGLSADGKQNKEKLAALNASLTALEQTLEPQKELERSGDQVKREIFILQAKLDLQELRSMRDDLVEKVRAAETLNNPSPTTVVAEQEGPPNP